MLLCFFQVIIIIGICYSLLNNDLPYFLVDIWMSSEQSSARSFCSTSAHSIDLLPVSTGTLLIRNVVGLFSARTAHSITVLMCIARSMTKQLGSVLMEMSMHCFVT